MQPFGVSPRLSLSLSSEPEPPSSAIVPVEVNKGNTQFAAGVLGGTVGLFLAGPIGASLGAGFLNYASKQEDEEISTAVNSVSSVAINLFNYATRLNEKYELLNQAQVQLEKSYEKIKGNASVDPATVQQGEWLWEGKRERRKKEQRRFSFAVAATERRARDKPL